MEFNNYHISEEGIVTNTKTGSILKGEINNAGYRRVQLTGRKRYFVHRLVAITYIPNPDNLPQVNHKNGNKLDNRVCNLEWVTASDNQKHCSRMLGKRIGLANGNNKHSDELVDLIKSKIEAGQSRRSISRELELPQSTVQQIYFNRIK